MGGSIHCIVIIAEVGIAWKAVEISIMPHILPGVYLPNVLSWP